MQPWLRCSMCLSSAVQCLLLCVVQSTSHLFRVAACSCDTMLYVPAASAAAAAVMWCGVLMCAGPSCAKPVQPTQLPRPDCTAAGTCTSECWATLACCCDYLCNLGSNGTLKTMIATPVSTPPLPRMRYLLRVCSTWQGLASTCTPLPPWSSGKPWGPTTDSLGWQCMQPAWWQQR